MPGDHTPDDRLEAYCLGRVPAEELEELEAHLLVCPACQDRLREADRYVQTMREAISALAGKPREELQSRGWLAWLWRPAPAAALGAVAMLALVWAALPMLHEARDPHPVTVSLEALRGESDGLAAWAPEKTPLLLRLDLTGVTPLVSYELRIVDSHGVTQFEASVRPEGERLVVPAGAKLPQGQYWVRLYDHSAPGTPLREYGLELR